MNNNRVVITGIGVSLPKISGKNDFWNNMLNKSYQFSVVKEKIDGLDKYRYSGLLDSVDLNDVPPIIIKQSDIATQFALSTALMALRDASIKIDDDITHDIGFFFGTELGGLTFAEIEYAKYVEKGFRYISPYLSIGMFYSAPIGQLSIILQAKGFSKTFCCGECSSSTAIGEAYRVIKDGLAKIIISGGYEKSTTLSSSLIYYDKELLAYGVDENSMQHSTPYDSNSGGMMLSDGSGMIVLEEYEQAKQRQANIVGEIVAFQQGFAQNNQKDALKTVIELALEEANLESKDIQFVHGSGLGLKNWDDIDQSLCKELFTSNTYFGCPANMFGNTIGAAGALAIISSIVSLNKKQVLTLDQNVAVENIVNTLVLTRSLEGNITAIIVSQK